MIGQVVVADDNSAEGLLPRLGQGRATNLPLLAFLWKGTHDRTMAAMDALSY